MIFAADQLDGIHEFFWIRIIKQEREALNGFVRQTAAAGFFPRQMLVKKVDRVACARELFTAHRAGRSSADDRYLGHGCVSLSAIHSVPARGIPAFSSIGDGS
jgi:hypothetical protein